MNRLAELRERRALTLRELSEMGGVAADTINQIELGHRKARPSTLRKLAKALDVDVRELFEEPALSGKVEAPQPDFEDERRVDVYGMVLAAARRQAEQDRQAATRALESERPQSYFMRHENEVVLRLLEQPRDAVAGTLVEMARHCVQLESQLKQSKEATSAEPARNAAT